MKTNEFLKDFVGDNEIVTVNASQLKKLIQQNENRNLLIDDLSKENELLKKTIQALKQQVVWDNAQKPRHVDLRA